MRVLLIHEGVCAKGETWPQRYKDMLREVQFADELGFDGYGTTEQHFGTGEAITTCPEVILAAVATITKNIKLRTASVNLLSYNNPIRVAERLATLDLISDGRAEFGAARSNSPYTLDGFNVPAELTQPYRNEMLTIIGKAFTNELLEHDSELFKIPPRKIVPWPHGRTPPPTHLSATSIGTHTFAGENGIGAMTGLAMLGWEHIGENVTAYRKGAENAQPTMGRITKRMSLNSLGLNCHKDRATARALSKQSSLEFMEVALRYFLQLAKMSPDYAYFSEIKKLEEHKDNYEYLLDSGPGFISGTPDDLIEAAKKIHDAGIDDVTWRIDGMGHENNMAALEMIGKHVLPAVHAFPDHPESTD